MVRNDAPPIYQEHGCRRPWYNTSSNHRTVRPYEIGELLDATRRSKARPARRFPRFMIPTAEISFAGAAAEILLPYVERLGGECMYFALGGVPMIGAFLPTQRLPLAMIALARVPRQSWDGDRSW